MRPKVVLGMLHTVVNTGISTLLWFALFMPRIAQNVLFDAFNFKQFFVQVCVFGHKLLLLWIL